MTGHGDTTPARVVAEAYRHGADPTFAQVVAGLGGPSADDESMADVVDADARERLRARLPVTLERYLEAIPDLASREVVLDAALEFALRGALAAGASEAEAAAALKARHPALAGAVDASRELSRALLATADRGASAAPAEMLALPCDVGPISMMGRPRYRLVSRLGSGAHGTAYLAEDRQLSTPGHAPALVCVKVLSPDPRNESRALQEASRARRINHPGVVRVLDRGAHQGREYIVYEFIEGRALDGYAEGLGRPMRPEEAARLMVRVARGVQAAHSAGLIHRDLKPDNILITAAGEPRITDFGAAAVVELDGTSVDEPWSARAGGGRAGPVGNLAFMAPEQFWMHPSGISPAADIYALGGLLAFLVTGSLPNGATADEVRSRHAGALRGAGADAGSPRPRTRAGRGVDADLLAIWRRAMAPTPDARHTSADALAADLEDWLARRPIGWTRPTLARQGVLAFRRQPLLYALMGALLVIVAISVYLVVTAGVL